MLKKACIQTAFRVIEDLKAVAHFIVLGAMAARNGLPASGTYHKPLEAENE